MLKYFSILFVCTTIFIVALSTHTLKSEPTDSTTLANNYAVDTMKFDDGPYVIINNDSLVELNIRNGNVKSKSFGLDTQKTIFQDEASVYKTTANIAALSDLHGQYELTMALFKNNGIIDEDLNWSFGKGHLVIVGDIFDRGPKVTELLWFVYNLEKQALNNGGKVHYVLGNHEYMIMQNDLRYLHKKYRHTEQLLKMPYNKLFGKQSVLGRWLRSKATIVKINDYLFVHGGISQEFIGSNFKLEEANQKMRQSLYEDETNTKMDSIYGNYFDSYAPIWYRGYFKDSLKKGHIKKILRQTDVDHIIVGHTSQRKIESLYSNKILAVDSSIKLGVTGEILLIENGRFYRGTMYGKKIELNE